MYVKYLSVPIEYMFKEEYTYFFGLQCVVDGALI